MENFSESVIKMYDLTQREMSILNYITKGYDNHEIASEIYVSVHTVKAHVSTIIKKLHAKNRTEAACKAVRTGICN